MREINQEILALEEESMMLKDAIEQDSEWADEFQIMKWRDRIFEIEIEQEDLKKTTTASKMHQLFYIKLTIV